MNIEKMLNNLTPQQLEMGLAKLSGVLSQDQMNQIKTVLKTSDKNELSEKLKNVDPSQINKIKNNPDFKDFFSNK